MDEKTKVLWLPCKLTDEETLAAAKSMAERLSAVGVLEDQLASVKKQIGADIDAANAKVAKFRDMVSTGIEHRDIECTLLYEWSRGKKVTVRKDTGEVAREETITESERQQNLLDSQRAPAVQ